MSRVRRTLGLLITGTVAALTLAMCGTSEGTVVGKANQGTYDYGCQAGGTMTGPVAVPAWGACSVPECWRLVVRDNHGNTSEPYVSREDYDRTHLGEFWRAPIDRPIDQ